MSATSLADTSRPLDLELPEVDLDVKKPADGRVFVVVCTGAVLFDLAVQAGVVGLAVALIASGRLTGIQPRVIALCAIPFGAFLAVRASDWLIVPDLLVAGGLLTLAAMTHDGRSVWELGFPQLVLRSAAALFHLVAAPAFVVGTEARARMRPPAAVVRGLALAAPLLLVIGLLLASADAVFASIFRLPSDAEDLVLHSVLLVVGGWGAAGLLRTASTTPPEPGPNDPHPRLGRTEANVVLGGLAALFAAFTASHVVTALGGADHVLQSRGLTYAEYARSGYFQLLAAAAITLLALLVLRAAADMRNSTLVLAESAAALMVVIVCVALYRLHLYEGAYGLTMLRLYCQVFAVWIAVVFVILAAYLAVPSLKGFPAKAGATGLAMLFLLNLANPEAMVVERNTARDKLDPYYLTTLSDDAVPALAKAGLHHLVDCDPASRQQDWASYNRARAAANAVRNRPGVCQP